MNRPVIMQKQRLVLLQPLLFPQLLLLLQLLEQVFNYLFVILVHLCVWTCLRASTKPSITNFYHNQFISIRSLCSFNNLLFKFNVSLPLVTRELLQNMVDVNDITYKLYNIKI